MRFLLIALLMMFFPVQAKAQDTIADFFDNLWPGSWWSSIKDWPDDHWEGQNYTNTLQSEAGVMSVSAKASDSMFAQGVSVSPNEFIQNLKKADIIRRVYNPKIGFFWESKLADQAVVEVGPNFYTLSYPEQMVITDMIGRAFEQETYLMKDWKTQKVVGQITPQGFQMF